MCCSPLRFGVGAPSRHQRRERLRAESPQRSTRMRRLMFTRCVALFVVAASGALAANLPVVDSSVRPGDAFFQYVNGAWLKAAQIPPDRASIGDDVLLSERSDQRTLEIIQDTAHDSKASVDARKVANYYNAFMDEAA